MNIIFLYGYADSGTMDSPPTPLHPAANEEVNTIPEGALPSATIDNLELNPELYDNDTDDNKINDEEVNDINTRSEGEHGNGLAFVIEALTTPFDKEYELLANEFEQSTNNNQIAKYQQSKLINYVDEQLLSVQRRFIKSQADRDEVYTLYQLMHDLSKIFDLIWYSINSKSGLFGQQEYLIKLMSDMEDYVAHYRLFDDVNNYPKLEGELLGFFSFFQQLDLRLSFLIDGFQMEGSNKTERLNSTQIIRLTPIASRLRIVIISKLDPLRLKLSQDLPLPDGKQKDSTELEKRNRLRNMVEVEVGRVFEGIMDRT